MEGILVWGRETVFTRVFFGSRPDCFGGLSGSKKQ
jgi:hypothetical protein